MQANFLRRLELNGFKSFAQKTVLEFPPGITAIVGPNGSGKSNVIDAIRWLLGEREAKNLRGAKVEDLIFAGTAKRSRLGQAQAGLYFDNQHKLFPMDFSEVAVLRQINRGGASKYFLNKAEVRLKDMIDFFARARLGTRGLVVVSQGNSDVFIQAAPPGRREMIEEMLGLREYQIKKGDAERRLKNAEINSEKVKALIEEILPHLRSLKRQTNRWEKRGVLEEELKDLENQFFGFQFGKLKEGISRIEKEIGERREEFDALQEERGKAQAHLDEVEANQPKEREEILKIKDKTRKLIDAKSQLQKEIGRLEAQLEVDAGSEATVLPHASQLLSVLQRVKYALEKNLEEEDPEEVRKVMESLIDEIDEALREGAARGEKRVDRDLPNRLGKVTKELAALEGEISDLRESESALEKNQQEFYSSFKEATAALERVKDKIEKWEVASQERRFGKERLEIRWADLERQAVQVGREVRDFADYDMAGEPAEGDLAALERQILKYRGDLASIGEIDEALIKEARETEERYKFLSRQLKDLEKAQDDLRDLILDLSEKIKTEFGSALSKINQEFNKFFHLMFGGGHAKLKMVRREPVIPKTVSGELSDETRKEGGEEAKEYPVREEKFEEEGIEIEVSLPRKRINSLEMLSGGERSLVGIAALFALISVSPPPFLVLDEIDAALDDRNARRFSEMLKEFSHKTQFIVVTHNRATMEAANVLYGVTMNDDGTSKILSLRLES